MLSLPVSHLGYQVIPSTRPNREKYLPPSTFTHPFQTLQPKTRLISLRIRLKTNDIPLPIIPRYGNRRQDVQELSSIARVVDELHAGVLHVLHLCF